jgi:predicted dehydrogenase
MIKIGTVGTGKIVDMILSSIVKTDGMICSAVYSRDEKRGSSLAQKYGIECVYTNYHQLLEDDNVNFVYLASPNSFHFEQAMKAMDAGKNVIIEKPFTSNHQEARKLMEKAKEKSLFLFEAVTTMYLPNYTAVKNQLNKIGRVRIVHCDFSQYSSRYNMLKEGSITNIFSPDYSGGALMDLGLYNIHFMVGLFGSPDRVYYFPNRYENGIDTSGILILVYSDFVCECTQAKDTQGSNGVQIQGEEGYIEIENSCNVCDLVHLVLKDKEYIYNENSMTDPWTHEMQQISKMVTAIDYEGCYNKLEITQEVMKVLDRARLDAGIIFPADNRDDIV